MPTAGVELMKTCEICGCSTTNERMCAPCTDDAFEDLKSIPQLREHIGYLLEENRNLWLAVTGLIFRVGTNEPPERIQQ